MPPQPHVRTSSPPRGATRRKSAGAVPHHSALRKEIHKESTKSIQSGPMPNVLAPNPRHPDDKGNGVRPAIMGTAAISSRRTRSATAERDLRTQAEEARRGVEQAVEELAAMEKRFRETVHKQRMAVLQSRFGHVPGVDPEKLSDRGRKRGVETPSDLGSERERKKPRCWPKKQQSKEEPEVKKERIENKALPEIRLEDVDAADGDYELSASRKDISTDDRTETQPELVNSEYFPLPWKGRLGYACLNTYLRSSNPSVFCSRTCRVSSILEHQHPLRDPDKPEHATKNRPDKTKPKDKNLGAEFVKALGLRNAEDLTRMIRWNEEFGIRFMRVSSEMFPFASHETHGYSLDFAADILREAGKLVAKWGHRVSVHPGQYTQIASPREEVITASIRDLEYHHQMLSLMGLPEQQDRDAVMVIHLGGTYGDKAATVTRFRHNYTTRLSEGVKKRLVLENDDVSWSVHDLLPLCEELEMPLVLDWHHHNIVYDANELRQGSEDVRKVVPRILNTWKCKGITPKMHYSEPTTGAVTKTEMRKHSARVERLPPCPNDMDLMIEAKDKEQAVFELMRKYKIDGWERVGDVVEGGRVVEGYGRDLGKGGDRDMDVDVNVVGDGKAEEVLDVGGKGRMVFWPVGQEGWLKVKKGKERKEKE